MSLMSRKAMLTIAAVIDIALHSRGKPVSAKALAARHHLPPRHLEPVLQALVREGILRGLRGPGGGYELAREAHTITADQILRVAGSIDDGDEQNTESPLVAEVIKPAITHAEKAFAEVLVRVSVEDMMRQAEAVNG